MIYHYGKGRVYLIILENRLFFWKKIPFRQYVGDSFPLQIFFYLKGKNIPFENLHTKVFLVQKSECKKTNCYKSNQTFWLCKKMSGQSVTKTMSKNLAKHYDDNNKEVDLSRQPHCCFFLDRDQREKNSVNSIGVTYIKNMRVPSFGLNEPIWFPTRSLKIDGSHAWWLARWSAPYRGNEKWGF